MFKKKNKPFETLGATVEWVDRETVRYTDNGNSTLVWVDYEPGFFSSGRVLRTESISKWQAHPSGTVAEIDAASRQRIEAAVIAYFNSQGVQCSLQA